MSSKLARGGSAPSTHRRTPQRTHRLLAAAACLALSFQGFARAGNYSWDNNGSLSGTGGTGYWDNTEKLWTTDGVNYVVWPGTGNVAVFGGTAATVTLNSTGIATSGLTFNTSGYTIAATIGDKLTLDSTTTFTTTGGTDTLDGSLVLITSGGAAAAITKTGSGTLAMSTNNTGALGSSSTPVTWTVTGGTYNNGTFDSVLSIGAGNNLGVAPASAATQLILDAGTLKITGTALAPAIGTTRTMQVNAAGGAIIDSTGNPFQGAVVDNAGSLSSLYLSNSAGTTSFSGIISGSGGLTWNGAGTLLLSNTNTYTGGTTIDAGTLQFSADANLGASTSVLRLNGGTLSDTQTAALTFTHTLATGTVGGTIALNGGVATNTANKLSLGTANQITGSGPITVTNTGFFSIGASNSAFSGNWTLNGGVTEITSGTALGTGSVTISSGAELSSLGSQVANPLFLNGGTISWDFFTNSGNYQGPVSLTGADTVSLTNFYSGAGSINGTISGNITGAGSLTTTDTNIGGTTVGGVLTLSGTANTYSGGTTIGAGTTLKLATGSSLGSSAGSLVVAGTLDLGGNSQAVSTFASQSASYYFDLGSAGVPNHLSASGAATLTGTGSSANQLTFRTSSSSSATAGTFPLISAASGMSTSSAFVFAGGENLTVPATSEIESIAGSNYRLTLNNSATALSLTVAPAPSKVLNIMPLGSSITAGQSAQSPYDGGGYRSQLYQNLVNDGRFTPSFQGSSTATLSNTPTGPDLMTTVGQTHHEGHPGYTTTQTLNNLNGNDNSSGNDGGYWLQTGNGVNPDYITLNIGGNDFVANTNDTTAIGRLDQILTQIASLRPNATVIVSNIMYRGDGSGTYAHGSTGTGGFENLYNPYIPGLVYQHTLAGQHVEFLDLYSAMTPGDSLANIGPDLIHPTQAGYDAMGNLWYSSITTGQAFFSGAQGQTWSTTSAGSTSWAMDYARTTDAGVVPSSNTDVYFNGVGGVTTLGSDFSVRSLNFTSGATSSVTIAGNNTLTIGSGGVTVQAGTAQHFVSSAVALGAAQTWSNVSSNTFTVSGNLSGSGALSIGTGTAAPGTTPLASSGVFNFSGNNTYTGGTTLNSGALRLNNTAGNGTGAGSITVNSGATLGGTGSAGADLASPNTSVAAVTINSGATITAGPDATTIGTLHTGNETWNSLGSLLIKVPAGTITTPTAGTTNDTLVMSGLTVSATSASPFNVSLSSLGSSTVLSAGQKLILATLPNSAQGYVSTILSQLQLKTTNVSAPSGYTLKLDEAYASGGGDELVAESVAATPEPTSLLLFAAAVSPILLSRRRLAVQ